MSVPADEIINHPPHYTAGRKYEPLDVIEDWGLTYHTGNAVKYISRAGRKMSVDKNNKITDEQLFRESEIADLKKAVFYLERRIKLLTDK